MKSAIAKVLGAMLLAVSIGWVTGCDIPDEKKSVFQKANSTQSDSSRGEQTTDTKRPADEKKKPHAFSKRDEVDV